MAFATDPQEQKRLADFFRLLDTWDRRSQQGVLSPAIDPDESFTEVANSLVKGDGERRASVPSPEPSRRGPAPSKDGVGVGPKVGRCREAVSKGGGVG